MGGVPSSETSRASPSSLRKHSICKVSPAPLAKEDDPHHPDAGKSASELADLIDADSTLPLQLAQISSGQLIASYDVMRDAQFSIAVPKTTLKLSREDTWLAQALPDVMATELSNSTYLSPESLASPKTTEFGLTSYAKEVKGGKASLTVGFATIAPTVRNHWPGVLRLFRWMRCPARLAPSPKGSPIALSPPSRRRGSWAKGILGKRGNQLMAKAGPSLERSVAPA